MGSALETLSPAKQNRLVALAEAYGQAHPGIPGQWRIDLIALDLASDGRLQALQHIEGAVEG
jgi:Holliday junction resolvase-like predicted endonuclease